MPLRKVKGECLKAFCPTISGIVWVGKGNQLEIVKMDKQSVWQTGRQAGRQADRQTDRYTDRQAGRQVDRQAGRLVDR